MAPEARRYAMSDYRTHPRSGPSEATAKCCTNGQFTLVSAKDFPNFPEMTWLIDDILPSSGIAAVYGPSKVGKSFLCIDMAVSVAAGLPWFGHQTQRCKVVYVVLEGHAGFRRRALGWALYQGITFPDDVKFVFDRFTLNTTDHPSSLASAINKSGGAGLIFIDTMNKAAPGADENSSSDMGRILAGAMALHEATGALVVLVHHPGKDASRGLRGHSSLLAALDAVIELDRDGERRRWRLDKIKDGEEGLSHAFELKVVELGVSASGKAIRTCVAVEVEGVAFLKKRNEPRGPNQQAILSAMQAILVQQRISTFLDPDSPDGIPFDEALMRIKDTLESVDPKHRGERSRDALLRLIEMGYVVRDGDLLGLPLG